MQENNDGLSSFLKVIFSNKETYKTFVKQFNFTNNKVTFKKQANIREIYTILDNLINVNNFSTINKFFVILSSISINTTNDELKNIIYELDNVYEYFDKHQKNNMYSEDIEAIKKSIKSIKEQYRKKYVEQEKAIQTNEAKALPKTQITQAKTLTGKFDKDYEYDYVYEHDYVLVYVDKTHKDLDKYHKPMYRPEILAIADLHNNILNKITSNKESYVLLADSINHLKNYSPDFESSGLFFIEKDIFSSEHDKHRILVDDTPPYSPIEVVLLDCLNFNALINSLKEGSIRHQSRTTHIILACKNDITNNTATGLYLQKDKDIKYDNGYIKLIPIDFNETNDSSLAHLCLKTLGINSLDLIKVELNTGTYFFYKNITITKNLTLINIYSLQEYIIKYLTSSTSRQYAEVLSYYSKEKNSDINKIIEYKLSNQQLALNAKNIFKVSDAKFNLECTNLLQNLSVSNLINDLFAPKIIASVIANDDKAFKIISNLVIDTIKQENSNKIQELKQEIDELNKNKYYLLKEYNEQKKAYDKLQNDEVQLRKQINKHNEVLHNQYANLKDNLYSAVCDAMLKNELVNYFKQQSNTPIYNNKALKLKNKQILNSVIITDKQDAFVKLMSMLKNIGVKDHYIHELALILLAAKACNTPLALCGPQAREIIDCISIFLQGTSAYYINLASCSNLDDIELNKDNDINKPFLILDNFFINLRSQIHNAKTIFKDYYYCYVLAYKDELLLEPKDIKSYALILNTQNIIYNCIDKNQHYYTINQYLIESVAECELNNFNKSDIEDELNLNNDISLAMLNQLIKKANNYSNFFTAKPLDINSIFEFLKQTLI